MTIQGPGERKRPNDSQPSADDIPEKSPRTEHGGRSIHGESVTPSVPSNNEPLSGAATQASESPIASRSVDPLVGGGHSLYVDESLINTSLQMMYQFYDDQVKFELFKSAQSSHAGQQVAITLANFFEYLNDGKNGTRQASAAITSQYQKAILQACVAFCAEDTTFVATLEKEPPEDFQLQKAISQELGNFESAFNLNPLEAGMIPQVRELFGNPEIQEGARQQMQAFLSYSGFLPHSSTLFIQSLIDIAGLPNLGAGKIETSKRDYVFLDNDDVIARTEEITSVPPVLEINSDGKDIPECFVKTYQYFGRFTVESPDSFVTESGEPYTGDVPARALMTREYILKPAHTAARFFIQFYSDDFTQLNTRRIVEATEDPFTCSSLLKKDHMQVSIDGILCVCGNFQGFYHKYLQKVEDGWLIFDEIEQQQRKVQNLSDAFGENDKPITLVCTLLPSAQDTSATSEPEPEPEPVEVEPDVEQVSHDSSGNDFPAISPSQMLVPIEREGSPDEGQESNPEDETYSGSNESLNTSETPRLIPELPTGLNDKLKRWQFQKKLLEDISHLYGFNAEGGASPEYPIPALPGLKPEMKFWTQDLMSYVIHKYGFDQPDEAGKVIHNPKWQIRSLKVLRADSPEYRTMLAELFKKEWQSYQSVPSLYYRLVKNNIPIPPLDGIPTELRGTTNWNEPLIADLLMKFCNLQESPLKPHPLVHEIIRCINDGRTIDDIIKQQNKRMTMADPNSAPGILPIQNEGFKQAPQKWGGDLVRYLIHSHLDFIKARCTVKLPKNFTLSDFDYLTLFDINHQDSREALKRLTKNALNNATDRSIFYKMMVSQVLLKPNQIPWCRMSDERWGEGSLKNLARHFGLIPANPGIPEYESLIIDALGKPNVMTPYNMALWLNRELEKNPAFKPPVLERLATPPEKWNSALVKVFVKQKFSGQIPATYKVLPDDILQIYAPDSSEYRDGLKQYLQTWINTADYVHFQGLLDFMNAPVKGRKFLAVTPFINELSESQRGVTPWTRDSLQVVTSKLGVENVPENKGSGMKEITEVYLSRQFPAKIEVIAKRLNRKSPTGTVIPVPDELKSLLKQPDPGKWSRPLTRLSIALLVRNTAELQSSLPEDLKVKKEDITQLIKPESRRLLPSHLQSMV